MKLRINIILLIITILGSSHVRSQTWDSLPGMLHGVVVYDMENYFDTLILAGNFIPGMSYTNSYSVIGWDSVNLFSYPGLSQTAAHCAYVYNNTLIAGGNFDDITISNDIQKLAFWNGTTWEQLGVKQWHQQAEVIHMAEYHDTLFIGGIGLHSEVNPELRYLVKWNGSNFYGCSPYADRCYGLCVFEDKLYSGLFSTFPLDNGEYVHGITAYDGEKWDHVYDNDGNIFTPQVSSLMVDTINHDFYIAGVYVYRWDGEEYHNIAELGGQVYYHAMSMYRGDLFIGGNFTSVNGIPVNYMARWDGTEWSGVSGGANSAIESLYEYKNELYVGGYFDTVGGYLPANGVARYYEPPVSDCHWLRPRVQTAVHQDTFYLTSAEPIAEISFVNNNAYAESWLWSFDGGTAFSSGDTVSNTYDTPGTYSIALEVTEDGCVKTVEKQIEVVDVTGISRELKNEDISLFPNPVMSSLYIKLPALDKPVKVSVYNSQGREVLNDSIPAGTRLYQLNVHKLSSGTYILKLNNITRSFVIE